MNKLANTRKSYSPVQASFIGGKYMPNTLGYLVTCQRLVRDQLVSLPTYQDVFHSLTISKDSTSVVQSFWVVGKFNTSDGGALKAELRFELPDRSHSEPVVLTGEAFPGSVELSAYFNLIKFTQVGTYYLRLKVNGEELETNNRFYFEIVKQT